MPSHWTTSARPFQSREIFSVKCLISLVSLSAHWVIFLSISNTISSRRVGILAMSFSLLWPFACFQSPSSYSGGRVFAWQRPELSVFSFSFSISAHTIVAFKAVRKHFLWRTFSSDLLSWSLYSFLLAVSSGISRVNRSSSTHLAESFPDPGSLVASGVPEGLGFRKGICSICTTRFLGISGSEINPLL